MTTTLEFEVFTIFPAAIAAFVDAGLMGKAIARELVAVRCTDLREFSNDRHHNVDDAPFGGGAGMVMKAGPVVDALDSVTAARGPMHRILLTPSAPRFDQRVAERLVCHDRIALICGRYEGIDDRVREGHVDECLSIGDFVLNGGEVAAAVIIEAVARLREGVLGNPESIAGESFAVGHQAGSGSGPGVGPGEGPGADPQADEWQPGVVLEHPQYTRPATFRDQPVPAVLLGGDHQAVARWRRRTACLRTWALRPELRPRFRLHQPVVFAAAGAELDDDGAALVEAAAGWAEVALLGRSRAAPGVRWDELRDLKPLQRELRKRCGAEPWLLGVAQAEPAASADPGAPGLRQILDVLAFERQEPPGPLIVWLGGPGHDAVARRQPLAWLALDEDRPRLAFGPGLIDISQPQAAPGCAASLARAALAVMRAGGLLRSLPSEHDPEISS